MAGTRGAYGFFSNTKVKLTYNHFDSMPEALGKEIVAFIRKVESEKGDKVMFIVVKKYTGTVDEDRATELREKYGETFVEEKSEMIMDNALLNKYADKLEALIMGNDFMDESEKENLFVQKVTYTIKSDAINEAFTCGNGDVEGLISDINPVLMLKETR